jgi:hypothetical protein
MTNSPQIITRMYDFILYLVPQVAKFPRSERYLLGERLEHAVFDVFESLLSASYSREKIVPLQHANIKLEQARYYVRLCKDLRFVSLHRYEVISKMMNEIGVQLGGWLKQQRGNNAKA